MYVLHDIWRVGEILFVINLQSDGSGVSRYLLLFIYGLSSFILDYLCLLWRLEILLGTGMCPGSDGLNTKQTQFRFDQDFVQGSYLVGYHWT